MRYLKHWLAVFALLWPSVANAQTLNMGIEQPYLQITGPNRLALLNVDNNFTPGHVILSSNIYAAAGSSQGTATPINVDFAIIIPVGSGQGVILPAAAAGAEEFIFNDGANNLSLYPLGTASINALSASAAYIIPPGFTGACVGVGATNWFCAISNVPPAYQYNTNTSTSGTTLTAANITGTFGFQDVTLNLTGTLGGAANAQLPLAASVISAFINAPAAGQGYRLRIINSSSANFTWTITTNTGWTLNGTMTIPQNTWRDFYVNITGAGAITLQQIGTGTNS